MEGPEFAIRFPRSFFPGILCHGSEIQRQFVTAKAERWSEPRITACQSPHDSRVEHLQAYDRRQTSKWVTVQNKKLKHDVRNSMTYRCIVDKIITS
jgi:hypothetical protein